MLCFSYLIFLPISSSSSGFYVSTGYMYFSAIDRSKLREEFLIYLDDVFRFFPLVVRTREFQVAVNGKTPIGSWQMDTVKNRGAFYKQADVRNDRRDEEGRYKRGCEARLRASSRIAAKWLLRFRANDKKLSVMTRDQPAPLSERARPGPVSRRVSREYGRFYEKSNFDSRP